MLSLLDLLKIKDFDLDSKTKLLRHKNKNYDINEIVLHDQLELYQSYQQENYFRGLEYIISFIGMEGTLAKFFGVYKIVDGPYDASEHPLPGDCIFKDDVPLENSVYYDLEKVDGFEDYEDRVIIDWGRATVSWHQWLKDKEVVEIIPSGYVKEFKGYHDFILDFKELELIVNNPTTNKEWHTMLSNVKGVYLISDRKSGKFYVGSAYGSDGILGRWKDYVSSGHGGNKELKNLIGDDDKYKYNLHFTILRTLSKSLPKQEVINIEETYKQKLFSKEYGLNLN